MCDTMGIDGHPANMHSHLKNEHHSSLHLEGPMPFLEMVCLMDMIGSSQKMFFFGKWRELKGLQNGKHGFCNVCKNVFGLLPNEVHTEPIVDMQNAHILIWKNEHHCLLCDGSPNFLVMKANKAGMPTVKLALQFFQNLFVPGKPQLWKNSVHVVCTEIFTSFYDNSH